MRVYCDKVCGVGVAEGMHHNSARKRRRNISGTAAPGQAVIRDGSREGQP